MPLLLPLLAMAAASLLVPAVRRLALATGALDHPTDRKVHATPIPRLGGLAVSGAFSIALAAGLATGAIDLRLFTAGRVDWLPLALGTLLVIGLGIVDDLRSVTAAQKLGVQLIAAYLVVDAGCLVRELGNPFGEGVIPLGALAVPLTMLWVIGITNALNLIDGLDGLAAGVALIVAATLGLAAGGLGRPDVALVALVLAGALAGFLFFNFNPAAIFLGDSGSLFLGYVLAVLSIESAHKGTTATFILTPILALGLPIMDTAFAIVRRVLQVRADTAPPAQSLAARLVAGVMRADRLHIHHRLMAVGLTHRRAVIVLYGLCALLNVGAVLTMHGEARDAAMVFTIVAASMFVGVRLLDYRSLLVRDETAARPHALLALADAATLALAYLAAGWLLADGRPDTAEGLPLVAPALAASGLEVTALLLGGAYHPNALTARRPGWRLVGALGLAAAVAMTGLSVLGLVGDRWAGVLALQFALGAFLLAATREAAAVRRALIQAIAPADGGPARPLRVLHVGKFFPPHRGGIETYVHALCTTLASEHAAEVAVDVVAANGEARTVREVVDGVPVTRLASLGTVRSLPLTPRLPLELLRRRADIVHVHLPNPLAELALLCSPLARLSRLVVTWHSDVVRQRFLGRLLRPLTERVLARAAAICVATPRHVTSSSVLPRFADKVRVCPFGVATDASVADAAAVAALRRRFGSRPLVLGVGRLVSYKGFDVLLHAVRDLDVTVVLVGEGPERAALEGLVAALGLGGRVHLVGEQTDTRPYFTACDVFVLPSTQQSEQFGIVQLEAMACAKPVVGTRLGTGVEWVNRHGETGLLVPPGDPHALRDAIATLAGDPVARLVLGLRGQRRVHREFTARHAAERVLAVYRQVMGIPVGAGAAVPAGDGPVPLPVPERGSVHVG
jgi:UDP-N-acetylmuramyl pentapeptide phosphotransferase/UDP-N-acetylglucosamine-1-phosphate transferase/glycosyltransferase involved in cell wall biosynthesis